MSTVYQLAEDVKQYAEIRSVSSGGGANSMKIKSSEGKMQYDSKIHRICSEEANKDQNMKKFMIIVDHDRINNVPMIKSQEG
jgi:hypothetical protein